MRWPSTITVQAPHWPWSQPFLTPIRSARSRSRSSSVTQGSISNEWGRPLSCSDTESVGSRCEAAVDAAVATGGSAYGGLMATPEDRARRQMPFLRCAAVACGPAPSRALAKRQPAWRRFRVDATAQVTVAHRLEMNSSYQRLAGSRGGAKLREPRLKEPRRVGNPRPGPVLHRDPHRDHGVFPDGLAAAPGSQARHASRFEIRTRFLQDLLPCP